MTGSTEGRDKAQIGLTPTGTLHLDRTMETGWFADRQDAYRVAIAVALSRDLAYKSVDMAGVVTAYNFSGGIDRDGLVRTLISILIPDEADTPAICAERLAHAGLAFLAEHLVDNEMMLHEVVGPVGVQRTD